MGYIRPDFPKMTSSSEKSSGIVGKASEKRRKSVGKARRKKKAGRGGWGEDHKKERGEGWVGDDVIKKNKK